MDDDFWILEEVAKALLSESEEAFRHYFVDLKEEPHPNPTLAKKAKTLYSQYQLKETFETFIQKFQEECRKRKEKRESQKETCVQTESLGGNDTRSVEVTEQDLYRPHRSVSVVPPFRKRKRIQATFNVVDFLIQKRKNDEVFSFKLQSDEDVQEELSRLQTTENKKMSLLANGILRKMAEQIDLMNQMYDYRLLQVDYEH